MPSPIAHSIIGCSFYYWYISRLNSRISKSLQIIFLSYYVFLSTLFDFDFFRFDNMTLSVSFKNHTRHSHSIFVLIIIFLIIYLISVFLKNRIPEYKLFLKMSFIALLSHLTLDMFCWDKNYSNGIGSPLFYPFGNECYISKVSLFFGLNRLDIFSFYNFAIIFIEILISLMLAVLIAKASAYYLIKNSKTLK
ncbi:MAG TPA: metal-dependent hydrolase [bacterium]|nr:metal-dependent hydrolase [bacterium]HPN30069.1 metal-dependent hydrolase [bacterium]